MKAEIRENGILFLIPESPTEVYACQKWWAERWEEEFYDHNGDPLYPYKILGIEGVRKYTE